MAMPPAYRIVSAPTLSASRRIPEPSTPVSVPCSFLTGTPNAMMGAALTVPMSAADGRPARGQRLLDVRPVREVDGRSRVAAGTRPHPAGGSIHEMPASSPSARIIAVSSFRMPSTSASLISVRARDRLEGPPARLHVAVHVRGAGVGPQRRLVDDSSDLVSEGTRPRRGLSPRVREEHDQDRRPPQRPPGRARTPCWSTTCARSPYRFRARYLSCRVRAALRVRVSLWGPRSRDSLRRPGIEPRSRRLCVPRPGRLGLGARSGQRGICAAGPTTG